MPLVDEMEASLQRERVKGMHLISKSFYLRQIKLTYSCSAPRNISEKHIFINKYQTGVYRCKNIIWSSDKQGLLFHTWLVLRHTNRDRFPCWQKCAQTRGNSVLCVSRSVEGVGREDQTKAKTTLFLASVSIILCVF